MHDRQAQQNTRTRWIQQVCLAVCLAVVVGLCAAAVEIDGVKITLQSRKYYARWDMTRFVYRVKSGDLTWGDDWILGAEPCALESVDSWSSSYYEWVETPMNGFRFDRYSKNQKS